MDSGSDPSDGGGSGQSGNDDGKNSDASPDVSDNDGRGAPASCDQSGTGEVMGAPMDAGDGDGDSSPSPAGMTEEDQVWDEAMHRALNLAKAEGKAPGGVEEALRGAHASTLD